MSGAVDAKAEIERLEKEKQKFEAFVKSTQARLNNEAFTSKAPANIIEGAKKQLADTQAKLEEIEKLLKTYKA